MLAAQHISDVGGVTGIMYAIGGFDIQKPFGAIVPKGLTNNRTISIIQIVDWSRLVRDISVLRERWATLFDEVLEVGREEERRATQTLIADLRSLLERIQTPSPPPLDPVPSAGTMQAELAQSKSYPSQRARPGFVLDATERYLEAASSPVGPLDIVKMAEADGVPLNPSSVRMALQTLRNKGSVRQVGRGDWESVRQSAFSAEHAEPASDTKDAPPSE